VEINLVLSSPWDLLEEDLEALEFRPVGGRDHRCLKKRGVEVLFCLGQKRDDAVGRDGGVGAPVEAVLPAVKRSVVADEEVVVDGLYSDLRKTWEREGESQRVESEGVGSKGKGMRARARVQPATDLPPYQPEIWLRCVSCTSSIGSSSHSIFEQASSEKVYLRSRRPKPQALSATARSLETLISS
jgi:hypothetical protein